MPVDQIELYRRFAAYDDETLWHILTTERAQYRGEALVAAEMVLRHRGVTPPPAPSHEAEPPPAAYGVAAARPQVPYQFIDLFVDVLLVMLAVWGWKKLWAWTEAPNWGGVLGSLAYWALTYAFLSSLYSLRRRWRAKQWN